MASGAKGPRSARSGSVAVEVDYAPAAEKVERIERFRADGLPVTSVYVAVPPGPEGRKMVRSEVDSLLHQVRPLAKDREQHHDARLSLRGDIERIETLAEEGSLKAGTLAAFSCSGAGFFEAVGLPRAVRGRATVDATPATRPMLAVLDEYHRCCAVVVDREIAYAWEMYLGEVSDTGALPGAKQRGIGHTVNERRNDHKLEELEKRHFRQVAGALEELWRAGGYDVLVAGGHADELPRFLQMLSRQLRERVAGTFAVDHHRVTPAVAREHAESILRDYELAGHKRLVATILEKAAAGGPAAVGLEPCLWAGSLQAVETLCVLDEAVEPGVVCEQAHWMGLEGETCPVCGRATRATPDVIDELVEAVIEEGGSLHHVPDGSGLDDRLAAASLRFPLPPAPQLLGGEGLTARA
jgi:peptide chain release factor subunit 1